MTDLANAHCIPCHGGVPKMTPTEIESMLPQVPEWHVVERNGIARLERSFKFKDFAQALAFANKVGEIAEQEDHHPSLLVEWGRVRVTWWTHAINGLFANDFIMAARTSELYTAQ